MDDVVRAPASGRGVVKRRVLLVEDLADARESLSRALVRAGYEVLEAPSAEVALASVGARPTLDAAVVDIVLGDDELAGVRLVPQLRARIPGLPIVVITAFADVAKVKQVLNDGAAYLLEKPFRAADLVDVLGRVQAQRDDLDRFVTTALARVGLTEKENAIARLVLKGLPTSEIARLESNREKTIRQHISQIYAKCGVASRSEFFHFVFPT